MPSNFLPTALSYTEHNLLSPLVGAKCAHRLLTLDLTAIDCFKLLISKCLGIAIILGGTVLKVPQILKIVAAGSADGISFVSYLLETVAYVISLGYNVRSGNPFSTYGESEFFFCHNFCVVLVFLELNVEMMPFFERNSGIHYASKPPHFNVNPHLHLTHGPSPSLPSHFFNIHLRPLYSHTCIAAPPNNPPIHNNPHRRRLQNPSNNQQLLQ